MNTDLEPPAVPPLSPDQRDRLRRQLMQRTRPAVRRTPAWAAPLVAVGAVAAIVVGTITVVQHPRTEQDPAASPSPSQKFESSKLPASSVPPQSDVILPFPDAVDLGPSSEADPSAKIDGCIARNSMQVLWSRRLKGAAPGSSFVLRLVKGTGRSTGIYSQQLAVCQQGGFFPIRDVDWDTAATSQRALSRLVGGNWSRQPTKMYYQQWTMYRARQDVARIESRYVWPGGSSAWIKGVVAEGFAYTDSRAIPVTKKAVTPTEQVRAFDAQGRPVPI